MQGSLVAQWLGLHAFTAEGVGLIPHQGTNILQAGRAKGKKMQVLKSHTSGHSGSERTEMEARHQASIAGLGLFLFWNLVCERNFTCILFCPFIYVADGLAQHLPSLPSSAHMCPRVCDDLMRLLSHSLRIIQLQSVAWYLGFSDHCLVARMYLPSHSQPALLKSLSSS